MDIEQLAGTRLGNYEIENLLGRGGMGITLCRFRSIIPIKRHMTTKLEVCQCEERWSLTEAMRKWCAGTLV